MDATVRNDSLLKRVASILVVIAAYAVVILGAAWLFTGCAGTHGVSSDALLDSIEFEGDLRCEGFGEISVFGFLSVRAEGLAAGGGSATAGGEVAGDGCAGVAIILDPFRWEWVSHHQSDARCKREPGMTWPKLEANHE